MTQIFISHSKRDTEFVDWFDKVFARLPVRAVRVEFEGYSVAPAKYIKEQLFLSVALFVLMGPNVESSPYTENWVAFEVGLAAAWKKDIWVFEPHDSTIQFPIPFLNRYVSLGFDDDFTLILEIVRQYSLLPIQRRFTQRFPVTCPYDNCKSEFRLHRKVSAFRCPSCRQDIMFQDGAQRSAI